MTKHFNMQSGVVCRVGFFFRVHLAAVFGLDHSLMCESLNVLLDIL